MEPSTAWSTPGEATPAWQQDNHVLTIWPYCFFNAPQNVVCPHGFQVTLLAHVKPAVDQQSSLVCTKHLMETKLPFADEIMLFLVKIEG